MMNQQKATWFHQKLLDWYQKHGRHDLPWQHPISAYRVWVSEIMLQQTQVKTVIPYFNRFIEHLPDVGSLAQEESDRVLSLWSGLGYYSRARNLHQTAKLIVSEYCNQFPLTVEQLCQLPGIGQSTASAITSIAYNQPTAILDGNVKRVLCRYYAITGWPEKTQVKKQLWKLAQELMPQTQCREYTQAIMDLGATLCTRHTPRCIDCPVKTNCLAYAQQKTTEFPHKKTPKPLPHHSSHMLLIANNQQQILLEKRPDSGIWGGLWCLPCFETAENMPSEFNLHYGMTCSEPSVLLKLKHRFSHYQLNITVWQCQLKKKEHSDHQTQTNSWFNQEQLNQVGLAKPISKALAKYFNCLEPVC